MTTRLKAIGLAAATLLTAGSAWAAPLKLENNWIQVGVSDYGTLGSNDRVSPGILYDPTGAKSYGVNDFLTPGSPHELFTLNYTRTGNAISLYNNNNGGGDFGFSPMTLAQVSSTEGTATGPSRSQDAGNVAIKHAYALNTDGTKHQIAISTTITNNGTDAMTGVRFFRSLDPDPDANVSGIYDTENKLVSSSQVCATGLISNQTICLLSNDSNYPDKIAGITPGWALNADDFISDSAGVTNTTSDDSIGLLFKIGDIAPGESKTLTYSYLLASTLVIATTPTISVACTPSPLTDSAGQKATCTLTSDTPIPTGGISINLGLTSTGAASRYTSTCTSPIAMAAGATTATCDIEATANNTAADGDLDTTLEILAGTGYNPSATAAKATVTIKNDDALLSIACTPNRLTDSVGQVSTCTISSDMAAPAAGLPFALQLASTGAASRYTSTCTSAMQIAAGATSTTCTVTATANTTAGDGDIVVNASLQAGANYEVSSTQGTSAVTVANDDAPTTGGVLPVLSLACAPSTLTDSAGQKAICTVTADKAPAAALNIQSTITSPTGRFTTTCSAPLTLAAGATTATCEVAAVANTVVGDGDVLITMALLADASYSLGGTASATVLVQDDDKTTGGGTVQAPTPVPVMSVWGLLAMSLSMLGGFAFWRRKMA